MTASALLSPPAGGSLRTDSRITRLAFRQHREALMAWVKLDDHLDEHDKVLALGDAVADCMWLLSRGLMMCNRKETDGHIPAAALGRIGSDFGAAKRRKLIDRLVEVGFLHTPGHDCPRCPQPIEGWQVHDYRDYQPTRAKKDQDRAEARERMRRARAGKKPPPPTEPPTEHDDRSPDVRTEHVANGSRSSDNPVPGPVPVNPPTSPSGRSSPRGSRLPDGWKPDDEPDLVAAVGGIDAARREYRKFRDYWHAKPGKDGRKLDWQATWRNWLRRAAEDRGGSGRPKGPPRPPDGDVDYRAGWHGREATP